MTLLVGAGAQVEAAEGQILQNQLAQLGIKVIFKQEDTSTEFNDVEQQKYQMAFSYWTMDIADPDELVTFAVDPAGGAHSFYTDYNNPTVIKLSHAAQRETNIAKRATGLRPARRPSRRMTRSWASSTTRRTAGRTRASCTASSSTPSGITTWRTPGWGSDAR